MEEDKGSMLEEDYDIHFFQGTTGKSNVTAPQCPM